MKDFKYTEKQKEDIIKALEQVINSDEDATDGGIIDAHQIRQMAFTHMDLKEFFGNTYIKHAVEDLNNYAVYFDHLKSKCNSPNLIEKDIANEVSIFLTKMYYNFMEVELHRAKCETVSSNKAA